MESESIRVRFAPSPTGLLHVGNARTALFNWLFARHTGGKLILRIEDTDQERSTNTFEKQLLDDLAWLGITWDEGPDLNDPAEKGNVGPYRQSKRAEIYSQHTIQLLAEGKAYRCFCTQEQLDEEKRRALADNRPAVYSGRCRELTRAEVKENLLRGRWYTVRLRLPDHPLRFHDALRGDVEVAADTVGDPVLVRSVQSGAAAGTNPGVPVYNYAVTVDDALMGITHVIRGDDHLANTPKQVAVYEAFGWTVPEFVHLPAVVGTDNERLSKKHGALAMSTFREMGYLPEALVNHLALLGWSPDGNKTEFTPDQLVHAFALNAIRTDPAIFDYEQLNALNRHYLKLVAPARLAALCWDYFGGYLPAKEEASDAVLVWFFHMIAMFAATVSRLDEIPAKAAFVFHMDPNLARADQENAKVLESGLASMIIAELTNRVRSKLGPVSAADFATYMKDVQTLTGASGDALNGPVRIALSGAVSGPAFDRLIPILEQGSALNLGIQSVRQRLEQFLGV